MNSKSLNSSRIRTRNVIKSNDSEIMNTATTKSMNRGSTLIEEAMLRQSKFKDKFAEQKIKKFNPNLTQQISSGVSVE